MREYNVDSMGMVWWILVSFHYHLYRIGNPQDSVAPGDGQLLAPDVVERFQ